MASTITVRRPDFEWPADLPPLPIPDDPVRASQLVGLSFTLPYLEPYLIRTMRVAAKEVTNDDLRADMKAFSGQEAQHFQQHARINDVVRAQLSESAAAEMTRLEEALEADYRRFTAEKSLAFNLAYAEGFEAMTFALARTSMDDPMSAAMAPEWLNLMAWHLAEEIEHRTVTFDAYDEIVGKYPYRVAIGTYAQIHFLRYLMQMGTVVMNDASDENLPVRTVAWRLTKRNWQSGALPGTLKALLPGYDPRNVELSESVRMIAASQGVELD